MDTLQSNINDNNNIVEELKPEILPELPVLNNNSDPNNQNITSNEESMDQVGTQEIKNNQLSENITVDTQIQNNNENIFNQKQQAERKLLLETLLDPEKNSKSYSNNSKKEEIILAYVENFVRQYSQLYPARKNLLISPKNEFGISKFISCTIRPSKLPYKELYDYRTCAKFVAGYLNYIPLNPPHEIPSVIPSPTYTLKLQEGTCFDYSILLTSLLRGVGYDAYVVSGYATNTITLIDESQADIQNVGLPSPFSLNIQSNGNNDSTDNSTNLKEDVNKKYKVRKPKLLQSNFLIKQAKKKKEAEVEAIKLKKQELQKQRQALNEEEDELKGLRIHSWVLVLPGKREIAEPFFLEPTTGKIYDCEDQNYLGVESIFSSKNYWVNMQVCYQGLKGISFDLADLSKWEPVLIEGTKRKNDELIENQSDDEEEENETDIIDLRPSWVDKLNITQEQLESKCPNGSKIVYYRNAKHEIFAEYNRPDGMVSRITYYTDPIEEFDGEIREFFLNRQDKLIERIHLPLKNIKYEFFNPGRNHSIKKHTIINGLTSEILYFSEARADGLAKKIVMDQKVIEYFEDREDGLFYRSVTFNDLVTNVKIIDNDSCIIKMTEKYKRNPVKLAHEDPAKLTYFVKEEKLRIIFHLDENRIIPTYREYKRPNAEQQQKGFTLELLNYFEIDPFMKPLKQQDLLTELLWILKCEQNCLLAIKMSAKELSELLELREQEDKEVLLDTSIYDTIRNKVQLPTEDEQNNTKTVEEESKSGDLDYLSPYLVNYSNPQKLNKEEALSIRDACLKGTKESLIEKANIIQNRLEQLSTQYQKRQLAYSRNADTMSFEETEEYVKYCNEALFKIQILEKRLAKHKEIAPQKYLEIDNRLRNDARLAIAFEK